MTAITCSQGLLKKSILLQARAECRWRKARADYWACKVKIWLFLVGLTIGAMACAKPHPVEAAFQKCTKNINIKSLENQPEAVRGVANNIASMGLKAWDLIKTVCKDQKSSACQVILEQ